MKIKYLILAVFCALSTYAQTELVASEDTALVHMTVIDDKGIPEENAKVFITSLDKTFHAETVTDVSGKFDVLLPEGKKYKFLVKKFGLDFVFDKDHQILEILKQEGETEHEQNIAIHVIVKSNLAQHLNVHFQSGKWDLSEEAKKEIDQLYYKMKARADMKVRISGHTDDIGDNAHNMKLSQLRANAVRDYLYAKGVAHNRVIAKGYGETQPLVPNKSDIERAQNRRITYEEIQDIGHK